MISSAPMGADLSWAAVVELRGAHQCRRACAVRL